MGTKGARRSEKKKESGMNVGMCKETTDMTTTTTTPMGLFCIYHGRQGVQNVPTGFSMVPSL
jgi:hypothetical protein